MKRQAPSPSISRGRTPNSSRSSRSPTHQSFLRMHRPSMQDQSRYRAARLTWSPPMTPRIAPFDSEKARKAVAYAIDRKTMVNLFGGPVLASPVCQVLPPEFPGHVDYCPYTKDPGGKWSAPDLDKAKKLVEESGTK